MTRAAPPAATSPRRPICFRRQPRPTSRTPWGRSRAAARAVSAEPGRAAPPHHGGDRTGDLGPPTRRRSIFVDRPARQSRDRLGATHARPTRRPVQQSQRWRQSVAAATDPARLRAVRHRPGRFGDPRARFTKEVRRYWIDERGISLLRSAPRHRPRAAACGADRRPLPPRAVVAAARQGLRGRSRSHCGIVELHRLGPRPPALEVNARFDRDNDRDRYDELVRIAENYWEAGHQPGESRHVAIGS